MVEMSDRRADEGPEPVPAPPVDEARLARRFGSRERWGMLKGSNTTVLPLGGRAACDRATPPVA